MTEPVQVPKAPPPPPLSPLQRDCQQYIAMDPALQKAFKDMQRSAKEREPYRTAMYAADVIEALTGKHGLSAWIANQFDEDF